MRNKKIIASFDKIEPGREAEERMLSAILEHSRSLGKEREKSMFKSKKFIIPAAACLALVIAAAGILTVRLTDKTDAQPPVGAEVSTASADSGQGVNIPAIELPEKTGGAAYDMVGLVVYKGGIYTQSAESYYDQDAEKLEGIIGDYLGYAKGTIDEWSTQDDYAEEFASTYSGEVYSVKGYDDSFRICVREEYDGGVWTVFLDRLNGITLTTGSDLFEDRLHVKGRVGSMEYQSHNDWDYALGNIKPVPFGQETFDRFLEELDKGAFFNAWMPDGSFYQDRPGSMIYDNPNQAHLYLNMEDGTVVRLRLIEGGYVGYESTGCWCFVRMPGEAFDEVYDGCGGTHVDW